MCGGVCMVGDHAWWEDIHDRVDVCGKGACMTGGVHGRGAYMQERQSLKQALRILLECILFLPFSAIFKLREKLVTLFFLILF